MKFPKTLLVKIERPDSGPAYFSAQTDALGLLEMGEEVQLAIYQLKETKIFRGVVEEVSGND